MKNRISQIALAATLGIAAMLAFSCSSDNGNGNGSNDNQPITKAKITGVSQKGPFAKGSSATLYELDSSFAQTGRSFRDIITDDNGTFEITNVELASPYAMLEADGFYRNEVTGQTSVAPIKLYAIADIREKDNVNVNLLTHLEYYRVLKLAEGGKTIAEAKKQAQKEILSVFGIDSDGFVNSEDMSIFGTTEGDAALLAISVLLQGHLSEGDFSQRLTSFAQSIKETGVWNGNKSEFIDVFDYAAINNAILSWGLSSKVPNFRKYADDYINDYVNSLDLIECTEEMPSAKIRIATGVAVSCASNGSWNLITTNLDKDCAEANIGQQLWDIRFGGSSTSYGIICMEGGYWMRVDLLNRNN